MTVTTVKWSLDDYHRMITAGILADRRVELLKGEIVEMAIKVTSDVIKIFIISTKSLSLNFCGIVVCLEQFRDNYPT